MNERIKELAAEAYRKVNPGPDPYGEADAAWMGFGELEKVFAELIVRECAGISEQHNRNYYTSHGQIIADKIKEHFGVEQ